MHRIEHHFVFCHWKLLILLRWATTCVPYQLVTHLRLIHSILTSCIQLSILTYSFIFLWFPRNRIELSHTGSLNDVFFNVFRSSFKLKLFYRSRLETFFACLSALLLHSYARKIRSWEPQTLFHVDLCHQGYKTVQLLASCQIQQPWYSLAAPYFFLVPHEQMSFNMNTVFSASHGTWICEGAVWAKS